METLRVTKKLDFSVTNDTSTLLFESQKAGSIPLWITIAASIGGLLIVIVIVIIMWKVFFVCICSWCLGRRFVFSAISSGELTRRNSFQRKMKPQVLTQTSDDHGNKPHPL